MSNHFFALFSRMKYINRWSLMRNNRTETLSQHCLEVAATAHALCIIGNRRLGKNYDAARAALLGIYHDMPEIITGDMPTPVKYYNKDIRNSFGEIEKAAEQALINTLPTDMREDYEKLLSVNADDELYKIIKAADKISALIKCIEEKNSGNNDFTKAELATREAIKKLDCPEAEIFINEFTGSFDLVLDSVLEEKGETK